MSNEVDFMNELTLARIIHLLGVVLWIGGVAMITTVLLPVTAKMHSVAEKIEFFEYIENRFTELRYWWMHAMVIVWLLYAIAIRFGATSILLYVLEPLVLCIGVLKTRCSTSQ